MHVVVVGCAVEVVVVAASVVPVAGVVVTVVRVCVVAVLVVVITVSSDAITRMQHSAHFADISKKKQNNFLVVIVTEIRRLDMGDGFRMI